MKFGLVRKEGTRVLEAYPMFCESGLDLKSHYHFPSGTLGFCVQLSLSLSMVNDYPRILCVFRRRSVVL